jgi:hypothetical protein
MKLRKALVIAAGMMSMANLLRGLQLLAIPGGFWEPLDIYLGVVTVFFAVAGFVFAEIDIRRMIKVAKAVDPIQSRKVGQKESAVAA